MWYCDTKEIIMKSNINLHSAENIDIDLNHDINVDFSSVDNIALQDVQRISDIHRVALINGRKLYIKNAAPEVMQLLSMIGLSKSFINFEDNFEKPEKRQRGF